MSFVSFKDCVVNPDEVSAIIPWNKQSVHYDEASQKEGSIILLKHDMSVFVKDLDPEEVLEKLKNN